MNELSADDYVMWMERLSHLAWPMTLDAFTALAPELGWHFTGYQYRYTGDFACGTRDVVVIDNKAEDVHTILFTLAKPTLQGVELLASLNDSFFHYYGAASAAWGTPIRTKQGKNPMAAWELQPGGIAEVTRSDNKVYTNFLTPQGTIFY